jgi:hypothetical protein
VDIRSGIDVYEGDACCSGGEVRIRPCTFGKIRFVIKWTEIRS